MVRLPHRPLNERGVTGRLSQASETPHVNFPGPLFLHDALAERFRHNAEYEERPPTSAPDRARLNLRIEVSIP